MRRRVVRRDPKPRRRADEFRKDLAVTSLVGEGNLMMRLIDGNGDFSHAGIQASARCRSDVIEIEVSGPFGRIFRQRATPRPGERTRRIHVEWKDRTVRFFLDGEEIGQQHAPLN
jgi:hypothetical protein